MDVFKKNWQVVIMILVILFSNTFITGRQIGSLEHEIKSQDKTDCRLIEEIKELRFELKKTNEVLYELKGKIK